MKINIKGYKVDEIEYKVKTVIAKELNLTVDKINNTDDLVENLKADSLDVVEIVLALEQLLNVSVSDENLSEMTTVQEVIDLAYKLQKG